MRSLRLRLPEPRPGESLSSWAYRLLCYAVKRPHFTNISEDCEGFLSRVDVDRGLTEGQWRELAQLMNISFNDIEGIVLRDQEAIDQSTDFYELVMRSRIAPSLRVGSIIIPSQYRSAYCYQCIQEGIASVRLPLMQQSWRYVLMPFCTEHRSVLLDAPTSASLRVSFPERVFKSHWSNSSSRERYEEMIRRDHVRLNLGLRVQDNILALLRSAPSEDFQWRIVGFVLTLMRIVLISRFANSYFNREIYYYEEWEEPKGFYTKFYNGPIRADAHTRARALYFVGLLLGWIHEEETNSPDAWDIYVPTSAASIWNIMSGSDQGHFMGRELSRYDNEMLSRSKLVDLPEVGFP